MTTHKKIFIGGLGALTPIIINLLAIDLTVLFLDITLFAVFGYLVRVVILFYLGGLVAYLHKDEKSPFKIFEFGIIAPALLTALINANNVEVPKMVHAATEIKTSYNIFISSVYAQTDSVNDKQQEQLKTFSMPNESFLQQVRRGLFGIKPKNVWFVVAGSFLSLDDAKKQMKKINAMKKNFDAKIYKPYGATPYYQVVIGENLILKKARFLQKRAIAEAGLKETTLWTFPED